MRPRSPSCRGRTIENKKKAKGIGQQRERGGRKAWCCSSSAQCYDEIVMECVGSPFYFTKKKGMCRSLKQFNLKLLSSIFFIISSPLGRFPTIILSPQDLSIQNKQQLSVSVLLILISSIKSIYNQSVQFLSIIARFFVDKKIRSDYPKVRTK